MQWIVYGILILAGAGIGYFINVTLYNKRITDADNEAVRILNNAKDEANRKSKEIELEFKEKLYKDRVQFETEIKDKRQDLTTLEKRLMQQQDNIDRKIDMLDKKDKDIAARDKELLDARDKISKSEKRYNELINEEVKKLEHVSGMTVNEAKEELKIKLVDDARLEVAYKIKRVEEEAKETAKRKASEIISLAIQKCAVDHVTETTVSVVDLPNDDMKGRIIGREGRNIRALEVATGIDLIIDDTPGAVILSGYDPIRREVARMSLEKLISDGRIHPSRIEDIVDKAKKELSAQIKEEGEHVSLEVGISGLHPEEIKLLGRLKYRTSYSQNVLQHSKEVAFLAGIMAAELGANVKIAKRAGLLHDIGKAVDHQTEGTHAQIGVDIAKRYNEPKEVIGAIGAHHEDIEHTSIESVLVAVADALSASRPGARREMLETYIKRVEDLERIGDSFKGVEKTYAIQAGREVRIIINPDELNDNDAIFLAKDIAKKIEKEMNYPGEIKITVVREKRSIEYAR